VEALAIEMYARGLSTRDIEALFADEDGRSLLSRTAVTEISERLWAEYEAFASRDLSEFDVIYLDVIYLFVDGIAERLHLGQPREAVLAAWGILADGKEGAAALGAGHQAKEDTASCREFQEMRRRGLPDPLLVVAMVPPVQSVRSRNASRARLPSAAWSTRCATCRATWVLSIAAAPITPLRPPHPS
jgi:putative transposase